MTAQTPQPIEYRPAGALDVSTALLEYRGPWNARLAAHLLRRAGFGGSPQEIAATANSGMQAAVAKLVHFGADTLPPAPTGDISYDNGPAADKMQRRNAIMVTELWWLNRCLLTPNPLQERMIYFWSNHFTSGIGQKGIMPALMVNQLALFRRYALGNFAKLTHEISRDPAMLRYLDGIVNRAQHPNENYARELMELFTMGVGNYSEEDVRQSARAFTGNTIDRATGTAMFNPRWHDDGIKTFLGRTGNFDGDNIVDIIMEQPVTARYMARKFLRAFVYDDPEPELVDALAVKFRATGYDVARLLGTILRSNVFYSARAYRALVKSPLEVAIGALKTLGANAVGARTLQALAQMGQMPLQPPNVAGWPGGRLWLNTGTYNARLNYLHQLVMFKPAANDSTVAMAMAGQGQAVPAGMDPHIFFSPAGHIAPPSAWVGGAAMNDPISVTERLLDTVVQGDATTEQSQDILHYMSTDGVGNRVPLSGENFEEKVRGGVSLAMALPTYQLA
ncbi:MAG: DUF1800 domain-containing protein [Candidatus Eremiobacteraeota bacterium]|nr:DUF1800 domain-containing protein [Candidatus Eremiobacteraeota bacterium]